MGREIRRVPPNWAHPKKDNGHYQPMFDETFDDALDEWNEGYKQWKAGTHTHQKSGRCEDGDTYSDWVGDPPSSGYHRPAFTEDATWYQVYETVSEGTPITPPISTKEELVTYLVEIGDFWDGQWNRESAEKFIKSEWAPSMMIVDNKIIKPTDM